MKTLCAVALLLIQAPLWALDVKLVEPVTVKTQHGEVTLQAGAVLQGAQVSGDNLSFMFVGESHTVPVSKTDFSAERLAEEKQRHAAENERTARANAKAREEAAQLASAVVLRVQVVQSLREGGALLDVLSYRMGAASSSASLGGGGGVGGGGYGRSGKLVFLTGLAGVPDGERLLIKAIPTGVYSYVDTEGAQRTVKRYKLVQMKKL